MVMKTRRNLIQTWLALLTLSTLNLQPSIALAQPVTNIAAGNTSYHSLFLKSDGSLWAMGWNIYGQLGNGTTNNINRPEQILASNATAIAAGESHSLFLMSDGSLWAMGYNRFGQLGDGTYNNVSRPEQIVASNVTAIAAGYSHSVFLKSDGGLWTMGDNQFGQLGDGTYGIAPNYGTNRPEEIVFSNVTAIAAGSDFSLFLKNDGSLWAMGENDLGQLGDGTYGASPLYDPNRPEQIVASNVTAIAAGSFFSLFLKNDGSLWGMGDKISGQLGDGTRGASPLFATNRPEQIVASNVTAIAAGGNHSLFLKNDGSLWAMGNNDYGQLGNGFYVTNIIFGQQRITGLGTNEPEQLVASNVTAIAAGYSHSLFLKSDGSLWAMGYNNDGQLGDGTTNNMNRPEQILGPYNQIQTTGQPLGGTNLQLSFVGVANANYALDWSSSLSPANWIPQATNPASSFGPLVFTNAPVLATNNFWRIRSVP